MEITNVDLIKILNYDENDLRNNYVLQKDNSKTFKEWKDDFLQKQKIIYEQDILLCLKNIHDNPNILEVDDISKYIDIQNREEWDYCLLDLTEALFNNKFLAFNKNNYRIYELTKDEYREIEEKIENKEVTV